MKDFYKNLETIDDFQDVFLVENHKKIPESWYVVITDVIGSTKAIEEGRYKDVNVAGGLSVMAVSNAFSDMDFPFVFGGDGITFLIPGSIHQIVSDILFDTRLKIKELFDLDLRVGMISISELYQKGQEINIIKLKVSEYYNQAILSGSGVDFAEDLIKQKNPENQYLIKQKINPEIFADFTGFTCRWKDIPSKKGETISNIIKIRPQQELNENHQLLEILEKFDHIFGEESEYHPLSLENIEPANDIAYLSREAIALSGKKEGIKFQLKLLKTRFEVLATSFIMKHRLKAKAYWYELANLKNYQILSSDFRKYDGTLKIVFQCTGESRIKWEKYLEELRQNGRIYYGIHVSDRALMTCILHEGSTREVHFVDCADGGYALAAKQLKKQIRDEKI